jgi:type VI secretion system protein ImpH
LTLDAADRSLLPSADQEEGRNCELGVNMILGERTWNVQSKFRLRLGPLSYAQFNDFLPDGAGLRPLCQMTRTYVGPELDFDVQPVLRAAEVPLCQLTADASDAPRLGWNTWLHGDAIARDVEDAVFSMQGI